jgi:hypothetical protein
MNNTARFLLRWTFRLGAIAWFIFAWFYVGDHPELNFGQGKGVFVPGVVFFIISIFCFQERAKL